MKPSNKSECIVLGNSLFCTQFDILKTTKVAQTKSQRTILLNCPAELNIYLLLSAALVLRGRHRNSHKDLAIAF